MTFHVCVLLFWQVIVQQFAAIPGDDGVIVKEAHCRVVRPQPTPVVTSHVTDSVMLSAIVVAFISVAILIVVAVLACKVINKFSVLYCKYCTVIVQSRSR